MSQPSSSAFDRRGPAIAAGAAPSTRHPAPPRWVADLFEGAPVFEAGATLHAMSSGDLAFLSTTIADAARLDVDALRGEVGRAYSAMGQALRSMHRHAIRWWNYLPDPGRLMAPGLDRYMVFNAGRHEGFRRSFSGRGGGDSLATASAVGAEGDDLTIHCLAAGTAGCAVENPRQTPAWRYSARYGPVPPSFSRATIASLGGRRRLLIGGTASVVGEDSTHVGDVQAQLEESCRNLAALIAAARQNPEPPQLSLARVQDVRVYVTRGRDVPLVEAALRKGCPRASGLELVPARLCRPELLVEVEGIAEL